MDLEADLPEDAFDRARTILLAHPGAAPLMVRVGKDNGSPAPRFRSRSIRVEPDGDTLSELKELFGKGKVRLVRTGSPTPPADQGW
jgi:hypothetical protein